MYVRSGGVDVHVKYYYSVPQPVAAITSVMWHHKPRLISWLDFATHLHIIRLFYICNHVLFFLYVFLYYQVIEGIITNKRERERENQQRVSIIAISLQSYTYTLDTHHGWLVVSSFVPISIPINLCQTQHANKKTMTMWLQNLLFLNYIKIASSTSLKLIIGKIPSCGWMQ